MKITRGSWSYSGIAGDLSIMGWKDGKRVCIAKVEVEGLTLEEIDANKVAIAHVPAFCALLKRAADSLRDYHEDCGRGEGGSLATEIFAAIGEQ